MPATMPRRAPRLKPSGPRIRRSPIRSTSVRDAGYDAETQTLEVQFIGGGLYRYAGVPQMIYEGLRIAASPGRYINERVRGRYRCHRVG